MDRCEDVRAHIADHLAGALAPATADAVAAHARSCAACASEFQAADDTWQRLGVLAAPGPDSASMRTRFQSALEDYQQEAKSTAGANRHWLQFAAAAAMLVVGIGIGRQTAPAPVADPQLADVRAELRMMREMVTLSLLQQQSASERLKGVTWTRAIDDPGSEVTAALLDTLMHDPNDNVRLATIDALKRFADREGVRRGAIDALDRQTSPLVQIALIDFVVEVNGREAADMLRRLSRDPMLDDAVRARAAQGLEQLG